MTPELNEMREVQGGTWERRVYRQQEKHMQGPQVGASLEHVRAGKRARVTTVK